MNSSELFTEGLTLLVLGMGTVFVFLALLVLVTSRMSALVQKYGPVEISDSMSMAAGGDERDQVLLAVISAAIHAHRSAKKQ